MLNPHFSFAPLFKFNLNKMKVFKSLQTSLLGATILILSASCSKEEMPGSSDSGVEAPATYAFERNGQSTVSYEGQTMRLAMGKELNAALLDFTKTKAELLAMYANQDSLGNDVDPFSNPDLNNSDKSLRSKSAASYDYFSMNVTEGAAIRAQIDAWIEAQVDEIFPFVNQAASPGVPGQVADGATPRYVNAKGLEFDQAVGKSLIGALTLDQLLNNYLSAAVLDAGSNREDNEAGILAEGQNHTIMEHKWDEAYGYLFGGAANGAEPLASLGGDDDFLNKYLGRLEGDPDFAGVAQRIFDAFKLGRAAIVGGDYDLRDAQADIIREELSEMIGIRCAFYLQAAKKAFANKEDGAALHDLSEAYGFIYSLRFTHNVADDSPYFTGAEVSGILNDLMGDGSHGLWDVSDQTLDDLSNRIADRFKFNLSQVRN